MKKFFLAICLLIVISSIFFLKNRLDKPWKSYKGQSCTYGVCETLEINQKYEYWLDQAIKKSNPNLCDNVEEYMPSDVPINRKEAIEYCKLDYHIQLDDEDYCYTLEENWKSNCLIALARKNRKPELCDKFKFSDEAKRKGIIETCKSQATRTD